MADWTAAFAEDRLPRHAGYRASYGHGLSALQRAQALALDAVPGVAETFHAPFPHNFVFLFVPRRQVLDDHLAAIRTLNAPVNAADRTLLHLCSADAEAAAGPAGEAARAAAARWRRHHRTGENLKTVAEAEVLFRALDPLHGGCYAASLRRRHPAAVEAFEALPEAFVGITRLGLVLPWERQAAVLGRLVPAVAAAGDAVARLEAARQGLAGDTDAFPRLSVVLAAPCRSVAEAEASPVVRHLRARLAEEPDVAVSVRVGYGLHHRYRALLGLATGSAGPT